MRSSGGTAEGVIGHQKDNSSYDGHDKAINVQTRYPRHSEQAKQPGANDRADDAKSDVEDKSLARLVTSLLPMKPAIRPSTTQATIDMT